MTKNYTVTRREVSTLLSEYTNKTARAIHRNADIKDKTDVIMAIINVIKKAVESIQLDDELISEITLAIANPKGGHYERKYVRRMLGSVNACFELLSRTMAVSNDPGEFRHSCLHVEAVDGGNKARLCWIPYQKSGVPMPRPGARQRVVILGRLLKTSFSTDLMRGARSMARELGAVLDDHRTWDDTVEMNHHVQSVALSGNPKTDVIVFYFVQPTSENVGCIEQLSTFATLHAGLDRPESISIDYGKSAQMIVEYLALNCKAEGKNSDSLVVLPVFDGLDKSHPIEVRQAIYRHQIEAGKQFSVKQLSLTYDFEHDSTDDSGFRAIEQAVEDDGEHKIVAIFGRSHQITLGAIKAVKKCKRGPESEFPIRVFGENITTDLLVSLNDSTDPLEAICSADPYYMGRYIVRAALNQLQEHNGKAISRLYPKVPPLLITKPVVMKNGSLFTIDRLPDVYNAVDVMLDSEQFSWHDWMIDHCPSTFGPSHIPTSTSLAGQYS